MFNKEQNSTIIVNANIEVVHNALRQAIYNIRKFSMKADDPMSHQMVVGVSISAFSWGETMHIYLSPLSQDQTQVHISSDSNLGTELAGKSKNRKNIEELIREMYAYLQMPQVAGQNFQ